MALTWILPACSTLPSQDADREQQLRLYELKSQELKARNNWNLSGKLAVSNGQDGGSGKFNWRQSPDSTQMDFHGALGRGAWRLEADGDDVRIDLADGSVYTAHTIDQLVREQLGWKIPVDSLSWWVRGMAAPGSSEKRLLDDRGNLVQLAQHGWVVEFGKYRTVGGFDLPLKLTAKQADRKVKLVVRHWGLPDSQESDD